MINVFLACSGNKVSVCLLYIMPKKRASGVCHEPLSLILGTQAKVAVLRTLAGSAVPLPHREVARRTGMAYRSVALAIDDLLASGLVRELEGGRERRVSLHASHRLAPVVAALLQAERDFFPSLRAELKTVAAGRAPDGLLAVAMVGAAATRTEQAGDPVELVIVAEDLDAAERWRDRFIAAAGHLTERFGVAFQCIAYDRPGARKVWASRTARAEGMVRGAESLIGPPLIQVVEAI